MKDKFKKLFEFMDLTGQLISRIEKLVIKLVSLAGWIAILISAIKMILAV